MIVDPDGELGLGPDGIAVIDPRGVVRHVAFGGPAIYALDVLTGLAELEAAA